MFASQSFLWDQGVKAVICVEDFFPPDGEDQAGGQGNVF